MSSNSIFSSFFSEGRWVGEMYRNFPKDHVVYINVDILPCVYTVPESLNGEKPEAYSPQHVGLGPYHHLRPELYSMQSKKIAAVKQFLNPEMLQNFQQMVEALASSDRELFLRGCYDQYLDLDSITIGWILVVDSLYSLKFLQNYHEMTKLVEDIFMMENQIPLDLLKEIRRMFQLSPSDGLDFDFLEGITALCREASPLELNMNEMEDIMENGKLHLLDAMYHSIVTYRAVLPMPTKRDEISPYENIKTAVAFGAAAGVPGAGLVQNQIELMEKVPWATILGPFKREDEQNPSVEVEEIDIPSVSQLTKTAGIRFAHTEGGIRDVKFDNHEGEKKFYLPLITIKSTSEVILRNLVAYEAAISAKTETTRELAEYVDLMCGIVDTPKDVSILKTENIIKSDLEDAEVARIFNGMRKSTGKVKDDEKKIMSNIDKTIEKVNEGYGRKPWVKVSRSIKKCVYGSWKFLTVLSVVIVLGLLVLQAFCQFYGCAKRWFK